MLQQSRVLIPLVLGALALPARAAPPAEALPPIRVVRVGHANVTAYKDNIKVSNEACRGAKHLPPAEPALPADDYLAKLAIFEDEQLFDGAKWAHYETQRSVAADATAGCALRLFVARRVTIEDTCTSRMTAFTPLMGELVDIEHPAMTPPGSSQEPHSPSTCTRPRKHAAIDLTGLPRIDAGHGVKCAWYSGVLEKAMAKIGAHARPDSGPTLDFCLYDQHPEYVSHGVSRQVIVKINAPLISRTGRDITQVFGETQGVTQELSELSDGTPIAAARFTAAAAKAFVAQPTRAGLGDK